MPFQITSIARFGYAAWFARRPFKLPAKRVSMFLWCRVGLHCVYATQGNDCVFGKLTESDLRRVGQSHPYKKEAS
jgi:hypothetical protein